MTASNQEVQQAALALIERVNSLTITNDADYAIVARVRKEEIEPALKELDRVFDPSIDAAKNSLAIAKAAKAEFADPLTAGKAFAKKLMDDYLTKKAAEQRAADAKRVAEENRLREEERKRQEAERLKEAEAAEKAGDNVKAEQLLESAAATVAVVLPPPPPVKASTVAPAIAGVVGRTVSDFVIVDPAKVKDEFKAIDNVKIGKLVRSIGKDAEAIVGGIEVIQRIVT
jgi:hypothetical protein